MNAIGIVIVVSGHILSPEPMGLPNLTHFFNGNAFGLREKVIDEDGHDEDEEGEEDEEAELHVAEHCEEDLCDKEGPEHVEGDVDALSGGADLQGEDLTGDQPTKRPPGPSISHDKCADRDHEDDSQIFWERHPPTKF